MNKVDIIKSFVVNKLGCDCPAAVFNIIKWQEDVKIDDEIILNYKFNIGDRLLIYIIEIEDANSLNQKLLKVIRIGINERNDNSFNRFRIVLISNNITEIGPMADNIFNNLNIDDQKVHLHVMNKTDILL